MANDLSLSISLKANISDLESKLKQAGRSVQDAWSAMQKVDPFERTSAGANKLSEEFRRANAEAGRLSSELSRQQTLASAFSTLSIRPFKDIDADIKSAQQAYATLKNSGELSMQALAQAKLKLSDRISELKSQTNGWTASLANAKVGLAAVAASFAAIGGAIKQAMNMESLNAKLKYATGSAESAAAALKFTGDMANKLGIDSIAAANGFAGIAAAAKGTVLEGENTRRIFESIATASRVVGLTSDQMGGALLAVQQMMSKGVVSAEEFRGQLGERLPGAARIAAEALGVTEARFAEMLETGQIVASDFLPKFAAALQGAMGPDAQAAAQSTAAQFERLTNHARDIAITLGSALLPAVNAIAGALSWAAQTAAEFAKAHPALAALATVGGTLAASWGTLVTVFAAGRVAFAGALASLLGAPAAFAAATGAANIFKAALGPLLLALTLGFEFGTWLNGFAIVQSAGAVMIGALMLGIESLRWAWEDFLAIFTSDTMEQANARHMARLQEIKTITGEMYADAKTKSDESTAAQVENENKVAAAAIASAQQQEAAYTGLNAILAEQNATRIAEITRYYDTLKAESEASNLKEGQKRAAETALFIASHEERMAALKDFYAKSEALINKDAETKKAGIKAGSDAEKAVDAEILETKRKLYADAAKAFAAHVDELNKEYYRHLDAVRDIEIQKLDFMRDAEAALRDIRMQGMTEYQKYQENIKQIDLLTSKARQAIVDGDLKKAQEYSKEAIALALANSKAVVDGDRKVVTESQARYTAQNKIVGIQKDMSAAFDAAKKSEQGKADQVKATWDESIKSLGDVKTALSDIEKKLSNTYALTISSNASAVQAEINNLMQPTSSTHTIYVTKVEKNATGGLVGGYARGGYVSNPLQAVQQFATGGAVFKKPSWLKVPGSGNGDTEPAALDAGSFVVKKSASQHYGDGLMGSIAKGVRKLAAGGFLGGGGFTGLGGGAGSVSFGGPTGIDPEILHKLAWIRSSAVLIDLWNFAHGGGRRKPWLGYYIGLEEMDQAEEGGPVLDRIMKLTDTAVSGYEGETQVANRIGPDYKPLKGKKFASGGSAGGTDTVPAMLTPGEWVVKKSAVAKYGLGFMEALNNMRIPKSALTGMPPVAHFAAGGLVGDRIPSSDRSGSSAATSSSSSTTVNINITGSDPLSDDNIRRKLIPALDAINKRSR